MTMELNKTKSWSNFIIEFVMIFLAIVFGFFADNFRERQSEKNDLIDYMKSLLVDLEMDRNHLKFNAEYGKITILGNDSLSRGLTSKNLVGKEMFLYHYYALFSTGIGIPFHDRTISQLKYSGKFRIITNQEVSDAIVDYEKKIAGLKESNEGLWQNNIIQLNQSTSSKLFDFTVIFQYQEAAKKYIDEMEKVGYPHDLKLLAYDNHSINQFRNALAVARKQDANVLKNNNEVLDMNIRLDSLIRRKYFY